MPRLDQILNALSLGVLTLDRALRIESWNRWMELHSGRRAAEVLGQPLLELFPSLDTPAFNRSCRSVLRLGNYSYFSQKLHRQLFPFDPPRSLGARFDQMQQSCVMGPIREEGGEISALFLVVQDVTELVAYEQALQDMNMHDGLTGVHNRRYLDHRLDVELERFRRYGRPLSVLLLDVDHFKAVNDRHGHTVGDVVLKGVAAALVARVRKSDLVARYGGEEFCCLLPETPREGALREAERLREAVAAVRHAGAEGELSVTVSIGVAEAATGDAAEVLLRRADAGLYEAKRTGRNRVVVLG